MSETAPPGARNDHPLNIGPYEIIRVLGEGGMGTVYEAEETVPVRRRVALKVIRAGQDSREVLSRFDGERRALAMMSHPGIAKVLHAASTDSGQPYFAMELVRGLPITAHCDARRMSVRDRIALFISVCQAVQHAHQKGIIHRDLKPNNVLVEEHDGAVQPKIIDFGIAKAIGANAAESTLLTLSGQAIGTAAYMSPEQADGLSMDVDTRADIYSLGVMLYELLVGQLPIDPSKVGLHSFLVRLAAGETDPPTPSARVTALAGEGKTLAELRRTDAGHLSCDLKGDLDWIVMKAMHTDRGMRYETANGLALDLRRYLSDQPVEARPTSAGYRLRKFVSRHRMGVLVGSALILTVVASAVLATVGFVRASRAERVAAREAAAARQVTDFLVGLFQVSDPGASRGNTLTARDILDRGTERVTAELADQPELQARIMQTMGTVHIALGQFEPARALLEDVLRTRERTLGPDDPAVGETLLALGDLARRRGDIEAAERYIVRALEVNTRALGAEHIDVATTTSGLAALRYTQGRTVEAESLYRKVLALDARVRQPDDPRIARDLNGLAAVYWAQKRFAPAESLFKLTLVQQERTLGSTHPSVAATLSNLGSVNWSQGRYAEALPYFQRALPVVERSLGPSHPTTAGVLNNLGEVQWKLRRFAESDSLFLRALAVKRRILKAGDASIAVTLSGLAGLRADQQQYAAADTLYREALEIRERALGAAHPFVGETLRDYAAMLRRAGRAGEAEILERRAETIGR